MFNPSSLCSVRFTLLYATFVAVGIVTNLGIQVTVAAALTTPLKIYLGMGLGALGSMVVKFHLDRRYIFSCGPGSLRQKGRQFAFYSLFGVVNILCFWTAELTFHFLFQPAAMRYLGALLGLVVGHSLKYRMDKHLVFGALLRDEAPASSRHLL
ncbi:GtrA family protein [Desulfohalobium retbaense]|uniref:Uncharacterized protein n=1 Tax=Desulfohalobium retbaense (strain ATCC 49708 / DSM 5692 / JCM 16813 / HR100) TaxID=485915 RepID=C8X3W9_DESRD|nr:GtrA family protein [Desulfohalobium retbaense]ACV69116.1 conserved hypothetical protein [Desulfohalobium retbaense DSM 5692]